MLLNNKYKRELQEIFSKVKAPIEVWAHGSRVDGTAHEGSDLDLVILGRDKEKLPLDIFMELKENIQESNIPILVELFDWARLPESFRQNIIAQHEVLYSNMTTTANESIVEYTSKKKNK